MGIYVVWFIVALALLVVELATTTFYALFLAAGAAAGGLVALVVPGSPLWLQFAVAVVVAMAGVAVVRPILGQRLRGHAGGATPGVHGGFVGQRALTMDIVGDELHPGHVRLAGEAWLAITEDHSTIGASAAVVVSAVRGTTLVVSAVRGTTLVVRPAGALPESAPEA